MGAERTKAKVVVVGDPVVGKRGLVRRSAYDPFDDRWVTTIGAKVSKKEIVLPVLLRDGTYIDLILWTMNPNVLRSPDTSLVRGAAGIVAVCDATRKKTLEDLGGIVDTVRMTSGDVPIVLAVNKCDLPEQRQIEVSDATRFASKYGAEFFFASALSGENVEATFQAIGEAIVTSRRNKPPGGEAQGPP